MGTKSSQPQTTTTVNRTEPDPLTQQWRTQLYGLAQDQFNQGMPGYFPGSTVVPFSDQTQAGLNYMQDYTSQGAFGLPQAQGALNRSMSGWNPAMPFATDMAAGSTNNPYGSTQTTAGINTLQQAANGDMIGQNPYLASMFDSGANKIQNAVNANFSAAGRYGSGAHQGAMASGMGDLYSSIYAPAYAQERQNQLGAAGQLGQFNAADLGRMGSLYDASANRRLEATGLIGDIYSTSNAQGMAAAGMLPSLYNYGLMPADTMMTAGAQYENLAGQYLNDAMTRYNYDANSGRANVSWLADMMNGLPTYGTTTGTTTQPGQRRSPLAGALGGAASGASVGANFGPWGAGIGAGIGALGGLFG
jgi:hypothetical protein